jgi:hypothetical protein
MKTAFAILFAIGFGGVGLAAQSIQPQQGASAACMQKLDDVRPCPAPASVPAACPVSMQATHLADGSLVKTGGAHPGGIGQWLSLSLSSDEKRIVKATFKVHGVKPTGHVTQALSLANGPDNITQTLTVPLSTETHRNAPANSWVHQEARANLWVPGMSAVDRIDLQSLDYSDGSTWKVADRQSCSIVPDPKMLITSR